MINAKDDYKFNRFNGVSAEEMRVYAITLKVMAEREIFDKEFSV